MAQDGRMDPDKGPKRDDAQAVKDGVSGNSSEGQKAWRDEAQRKDPDVVNGQEPLSPASGSNS